MKILIKQNDSISNKADIIEENEGVIVRLAACGICGSDIRNIFGKSCKPTTKIGHEISGIIEKNNNISNFNEGDRVFVHHHSSCNICYYCIHGNHTMCEKFVDSVIPCGLSSEFFLPKWNIEHGALIKIPDLMSDEEASFIEPLACCLRACKKLNISDLKSIVIFGTGPMGVLHALLAKYFGVKKIFGIDVNLFRLNFIKQKNIAIPLSYYESSLVDDIKIRTNDWGADVVIIATSEIRVFKEAVEIVRKGGTILLFGEPDKSASIDLDMSIVYSKEISLVTSYAASFDNVLEAYDLIQKKIINVEQLITHKFSINDAKKAIDCARFGRNSMKVMVIND